MIEQLNLLDEPIVQIDETHWEIYKGKKLVGLFEVDAVGWSFTTFKGEKDIELFHKQFRLLAKAEHLIEEEKRYYLRLITKLNFYGHQKYLRKLTADGEFYIAGPEESEASQSIFTESEIAEMDITGFEKVEVSND